MSGIDVVGLAFTVVPLIVMVAKTYREPLAAMLRQRPAQAKLTEFYRDLLYEVTILDNTLSEVFGRLPREKRPRADSLVDDKPTLEILADRLGEADKAFMEILRDNMEFFEHLVTSSSIGPRNSAQVGPHTVEKEAGGSL